MTRNTVLTDKSGNPLAPATTAEQVAYDNEKNVKQVIDDKATKQEVDVERKRIDTFTSLPDGATTGDAELADIRVAADGKKYNTAGEAVRAQANAAVKTQQGIRYVGKCLTVGSDGNLYPSITPPAIYLPAKGEFITTTDSTAYPLGDIKLYGRSIQDGEPSPDTPIPIVSVGEYNEETEKYEIGIGVTGKNLVDASRISGKTSQGATVTNNGDGTFAISGSGNLLSDFWSVYTIYHDEILKILHVGKIKVSGITATRPNFIFQFRNQKKIFVELIPSNVEGEITQKMLDDENSYIVIGFYGMSGLQIVSGTVRPIVQQVGDGTWEPFKQQLSTLQIPNPLRGIPVDSGGNYTDSDGQQWICDYIDRERGKYVQCVQEIVFDGSNDESWAKNNPQENDDYTYYIFLNKIATNVICDKLENKTYSLSGKDIGIVADNPIWSNTLYVNFGDIIGKNNLNNFVNYLKANPITVICALKSTIETDLTPDQLAALNLSTYEGVTNIGTDSNAGIEIRYGVDTQTYINNKIAELTENLSLMQSTVPEET